MTSNRISVLPEAAPVNKEAIWFLTGCIEEGEPVREIPLNTSPFRIGRRTDLSLCLPSRNVSKLHAELLVADDALFLRDLNSTNGTYLNGGRIEGDVPVGTGDLIQFADREFRIGRRTAESCGRTMTSSSFEWTWSLTQFDKLLAERAIIPAFQPIVSLDNKQVVGFEVLARSNLQGLENPRDMFYTASQLYLEAELSTLCRWEGVHAGQNLPSSPNLFVNTHPAEQLMPGLLDSLRELRNAVPTQPVTIEIHEGAITDTNEMKKFHAALQDLDMQLAYDDFGAGQARLLDLIEAPPDYLKFDLKLIRGIHEQQFANRQQMLATLVRMIRECGSSALAEGIECDEEAEVCQELGFELAQGYHFGKPAPVEAWA